MIMKLLIILYISALAYAAPTSELPKNSMFTHTSLLLISELEH